MKKCFKILALCDCLDKICEFDSEFDGLSGARIQYLVCNNQRFPKWRYFAAEVIGFLRRNSIRKWLLIVSLFLKRKIILSPNKLSSKKVISWLTKKQFDIGFHSMGVIYKKEVINTFLFGIINPHIGKLPEMRGRCVMEWSLLNNIPIGVSSFFIDSGIDTGSKLLFFESYDLPPKFCIKEAKTFLFSRDIEIFKKSVDFLKDKKSFEFNNINQGKRYYVMSQLLLGVVEKKLVKQNQCL